MRCEAIADMLGAAGGGMVIREGNADLP